MTCSQNISSGLSGTSPGTDMPRKKTHPATGLETARMTAEKAYRHMRAAAQKYIKAEKRGYEARLPGLLADLQKRQKALYEARDALYQAEDRATNEYGLFPDGGTGQDLPSQD